MKPGDRVWTTMVVHSDAYDTGDGRIVEHLVDSQYHVGVDGVAIHRANPSSVIPDSPALPAVARWLVDHPEASSALTLILDDTREAYQTVGPTMHDAIVVLEELVSVLSVWPEGKLPSILSVPLRDCDCGDAEECDCPVSTIDTGSDEVRR